MSYINPTSWTDVDFAGNPLSWTSRTHKLLYPAYEMLRLALIERSNAMDYPIPVVLNTPITSHTLISDAWKTAFQSQVSSLYPNYVNHLDSGGDWTGALTAGGFFAPYWTATTILAAIAEPARLPVPDIFRSDWEIQQYKLLNMLRWSKFGAAGGPVLMTASGGAYEGKAVASTVSWADCEALFAAAAWVGWGVGETFYMSSYAPASIEWSKRARRWRSFSVQWVVPAGKPYFFVDAYIVADSTSGAFGDPLNFIAVDGSTVFQRYNRVFQSGEAAIPVLTIWENEADLMGLADPAGFAHNTANNINTSGGAIRRFSDAVVKFDGPNGFKFKDW